MLPVLVEPADATTARGRYPALRSSAIIDSRTGMRILKLWSVGTMRRFAEPIPSSSIALRMHVWPWSETYTRRRGPPARPSSRSSHPDRAWRAVARPVRLAIEPPDTRTPPEAVGKPTRSRNHSRTRRSRWTAAWFATSQCGFIAAASASPKTAMTLAGEQTHAQNRPWLFPSGYGAISSRNAASSCAGSAPSSGSDPEPNILARSGGTGR